MTNPSTLEYASPKPVIVDRGKRLAWASLALCIFQIPWFMVGGMAFYISAPAWLQFLIYDSFLYRCLSFLVFSLPAALALLAATRSITRRPAYHLTRILAIVGLLLSSILIAAVFYTTIVDPGNPHDPGYWL